MSSIETDLIEYVNECIDTISTNAGEITKLWEEVGKKQDKLIAGNGILIVGNVISTTDDGMKPGDGLWLDEDVLNVDFSRVQSKIKCGDVSAFENEANQAVGDFFIVENNEKPSEDSTEKVATFEAKPISTYAVSFSPPSIEQTGKGEETYSSAPTLGASSNESDDNNLKNESTSLTFSNNSVKGTDEDTGSSASTVPALTIRNSSDTGTGLNPVRLTFGK